MNIATQQYIKQHINEDVRQLALRGCKDMEVDLSLALQQIAGYQMAITKLPSWSAVEGMLYPPHLNMEQCSSEQTARYKAKLVENLLLGDSGQSRLVDLTGGFGVDFAWMSAKFCEAVYVERDASLFAISDKNFKTLGLQNVKTYCTDGVKFLRTLDEATVIFLDPARRDQHGGRTYGIADCTPNVLLLAEELLCKSTWVLLKLSPMLDWQRAVDELGPDRVREIHIVSVGGECKELLVVLTEKYPDNGGIKVFCVNDDQMFTFLFKGKRLSHSTAFQKGLEAGLYLYEPNASVMKAGCFNELAELYEVKALSANSHLFVSDHLIQDFPGRRFLILAVSSMNKKELHEKIQPLGCANITVRNFPLSVVDLRKRLKLREGGDNYLFATTTNSGERLLLVCQRAQESLTL